MGDAWQHGDSVPSPKCPKPFTHPCACRGYRENHLAQCLCKKQRKTKGQRRGQGVVAASAAAGARTLAPATGQSPGLLAGPNVSHRQHQMQTRRSSPAVSLRGLQTPLSWLFFTRRLQAARPRLLLGRKAIFLRLTSPGPARWLPNGWREGPCLGKLAKFAYGEGEPPPQLSRIT